MDVGAVAGAGAVTYGSTAMSITSRGADVNSTADRFSFVYRPITGNATIIARVASLPAVTAWAQAGVMIRESLQPGARHGYVMMTAGNGTMFRRRVTAGGSTAQTTAVSLSGVKSSWLKLQRVGTTLTAWSSSDGVDWNTIGSATISLPATAYVGLAVASGSTSAVTASIADVVAIGNGTLDAGFTGADIGGPTTTGGSWSSSGAFTLDGAGLGIGGTFDQFRFVYKLVSGDMDIVSRVADFDFVTTNARAGLMVRTTTGSTSAHRSLLVGPQGLQFVSRAATAGTTSVTSAGSRTAPVWLKASRRGTVLTFSHSLDNVTWTQVAQHSVSGSFYVGLAVTSTYASRVVRANFTNTVLSLGASNQAPAVNLTSPAGAISITGPLALAATASDSDGSVVSVAFYANTTLLGTDTTSPYQATFSTSLPGVYAITAVAKDNGGATTTSATRTVTVAGTTATIVSLTSPQDGGIYTAPAQIALAATATAAGGVQRVAFYANGTLLGTDTTSPYSWTWSNVPTGGYAVTAVAYDFSGAMTVSSTRDINVVAAGVPTTLKFTPASLLELVLRYVLEIFPAGANPSTATPVKTLDLGLPPIFSNEATVNIASTINALPPGQYIATVSALRLLAPELQSPPSPPFTR